MSVLGYIKKIGLGILSGLAFTNAKAQTFDISGLNIEESGVELKMQIQNPNGIVSYFERSLGYNIDSFKYDSLPIIKFYRGKSDYNVDHISLSGTVGNLISANQYLQKDTTKWVRYKIISNYRSYYNINTFKEDTLFALFSPNQDSFVVVKSDTNTYQLFGVKNNGAWQFCFKDSSHTVITNYFDSKNPITKIYNLKGKEVYSHQVGGEFKLINDTSVFKLGLALPDCLLVQGYRSHTYFKDYSISQGFNQDSIGNLTFFDVSFKIQLSSGRVIYVYNDAIYLGERSGMLSLINYYKTIKKLTKGVEIQDFSYPTYNQQWGAFVPNLSILDVLFNYGPDII